MEKKINPLLNIHRIYNKMNLINPYIYEKLYPTDYVAYYKFDNNANDATGNFNPTINNVNTYITNRKGIANSAGSYVGSSSPIMQIGYTNFFNVGTNPFTISFWVRPTTQADGIVIALFGVSSTNVVMLRFRVADLKIYTYVRDTNGNGVANLASSANFTLNTWAFVTLRKNANNTVQLRIGTTWYSLGTTSGNVNLDSANKFIFSQGSVPTPFSGALDDVFFYNRALTDNEVTSLYNL
jgi:hypothetical protein